MSKPSEIGNIRLLHSHATFISGLKGISVADAADLIAVQNGFKNWDDLLKKARGRWPRRLPPDLAESFYVGPLSEQRRTRINQAYIDHLSEQPLAGIHIPASGRTLVSIVREISGWPRGLRSTKKLDSHVMVLVGQPESSHNRRIARIAFLFMELADTGLRSWPEAKIFHDSYDVSGRRVSRRTVMRKQGDVANLTDAEHVFLGMAFAAYERQRPRALQYIWSE